MYTIEFYEKSNGESEIWEFLESLRKKASTNKDARIQYKQTVLYIQLLQDNGTRLPENVTKHLGDGIWELRPGNNRVFYFYFNNDTFVLLHQFRKNGRKHHAAKLTRPNQSVMITYPERRLKKHENLERLQKPCKGS